MPLGTEPHPSRETVGEADLWTVGRLTYGGAMLNCYTALSQRWAEYVQ
jgi:hypothetical protein